MSELINLPEDIICYILKYLRPYDCLITTNTCISLRWNNLIIFNIVNLQNDNLESFFSYLCSINNVSMERFNFVLSCSPNIHLVDNNLITL